MHGLTELVQCSRLAILFLVPILPSTRNNADGRVKPMATTLSRSRSMYGDLGFLRFIEKLLISIPNSMKEVTNLAEDWTGHDQTPTL